MRTIDIISAVNKSISEGSKAKAYREMRTPIFGKFLALSDHEDLMSKGMVRFLSESRADQYAVKPDITLTRIYVLRSFYIILKVN